MQLSCQLLRPWQICATETAQSLALAADLLQLVGTITGLFELTKGESLNLSQIHF